MIELSWLIELTKLIGFPAVIFGIWLISHLAHQKTIEALQKQSEETVNNLQSQYDRIINLQKDQTDRSFELLKEIAKTNEMQVGLISELKTMIQLNQFCPIVKERSRQ